jgi:hypothetical protein
MQEIWDDFFALIYSINVPSDFMAERPMNVLPKERNLFERIDEPLILENWHQS